MKKIIAIISLSITLTNLFAGSFIAELENSIERARKGSKVEYILHLTNGEEYIITGHDFTKGSVERKGDIPLYFELYKGSGDKKQNIMINIQNAIYYQLYIEKDMGVWDYEFHFYY